MACAVSWERLGSRKAVSHRFGGNGNRLQEDDDIAVGPALAFARRAAFPAFPDGSGDGNGSRSDGSSDQSRLTQRKKFLVTLLTRSTHHP